MSLPSEPITRKEQYLAKAAGQAVEIPAEPITREEAYLDAIAKGSGGGGGGTSDYSQLTNKPQINGNTLTGNKTASQLGLASTADLARKVDKVEGYGLSENDYTDEDKAIVGGVTEALAGKQDILIFDSVPTNGSTNPVESNGVYDALASKADASAVKNEFLGTLEEWDALTTAEKKAYDTYQITNDFTGGSGLPNYSTSEQKTGQKWIDDSDIYFKSVDIGALPNRTYKDVQTGITNVKDICRIEGISTNGAIYVTIPHGANTASYGVELSFDKQNNTIRVSASEDQSSYTGIVTLYYTKTA